MVEGKNPLSQAVLMSSDTVACFPPLPSKSLFWFFFKRRKGPGVVVHTVNPRNQMAEAGSTLRLQDQPGLDREFQASQDM